MLRVYAMFPLFRSSFLLYVNVRVMCSYAWYHVYGYALLRSMCSYAFYHVLCLDPHLYTLIRLDSCSSCLCAKLSHVHTCVARPMPRSMFMCLDLCFHLFGCLDPGFHMLVWLDLCPLHALRYLPYAYALHDMFVCLDLGYVCHAICYCSLFVAFSFFLVFWPIGSDLI